MTSRQVGATAPAIQKQRGVRESEQIRRNWFHGTHRRAEHAERDNHNEQRNEGPPHTTPSSTNPGEGEGPTNTFRERSKSCPNLDCVIRCEITDAYAKRNAADSRSKPGRSGRDSGAEHSGSATSTVKAPRAGCGA